MEKHTSPEELPALKEWNRILDMPNLDWTQILENFFKNITNNNKLIQFQYKLLMRISTCKYMRYKMKIVKDNGQCSLCDKYLETLEHIFLNCSHTKAFCEKLSNFIRNSIDREFRDRKKLHFILCNHTNSTINYINLTAKWYISKSFHNSRPLIWDEYIRYIKLALNGERQIIRVAILEVINS